MPEANKVKWLRRSQLVSSGAGLEGYSHASHACIALVEGDIHRIIFSMRSLNKRASLFSQLCVVKDGFIEMIGEPELTLGPGKMGTFDCEGLLACCLLKESDNSTNAMLYYSGWNNYAESLWLCDTGLADLNLVDGSCERRFEGPVMSRDRYNPYFAAGTSVIKENGKFRSWYNSGLSWEPDPLVTWKPRYGIKYAESTNGVDWRYMENLVIPFKDEFEHSFGRPTVVSWDGGYHMWFSCRGAGGDPIYKMGYAFSEDGYDWARDDSRAGLEPTNKSGDFDSESVAYPYPFEHAGIRYLLYTGNGYGRDGFGYAVMSSL